MGSKSTRFSTFRVKLQSSDSCEMGRGPGAILGLFFFGLGSIQAFGASPTAPSAHPMVSAHPATSVSVTPSAGVSPKTSTEPAPSPSASPSPSAAPLTTAESRQLLAEFNRAQSNELAALKHRQEMELQELKAAQGARRKEWEEKEKAARRQFFSEHSKGPERRAYIKDFIERRNAFLQVLKDEKAQRQKSFEVRLQSVKEDQAGKLKEFQEYLGRQERPPTRLWP